MSTADPFSAAASAGPAPVRPSLPPGGAFSAADPIFVAAPKALLHDHLDGGLRPATVVELAADVGHPLPAHGRPGRWPEWFVAAAVVRVAGALPGDVRRTPSR